MLGAYFPCMNFDINREKFCGKIYSAKSSKCLEAKWNPGKGHIPRGFIGATGKLSDVEVMMVFAEPGHPHDIETYNPRLNADELLAAGVSQTYSFMFEQTDLFHKNVRFFLDQLYPELSFLQQLQFVWMTEGRLCSLDDETGRKSHGEICAGIYLRKQLELLPKATVVAFGKKAQKLMSNFRREFIKASSFADPEGRKPRAKESWKIALENIKSLRGTN